MPPKALEQEIQARVASFAAELGALIRQSVLDGLHQALGSAPAPRATAAAAAAPAAPAAKGRGKKAGRKAGAKASASGPLADTLTAYIADNAGSRIEQIAKALGKPSSSLKPIVANMLASGQLRKEGQKRGTTYFIGKGGAAAPAAASEGDAPAAPAKRGGRRKAGGKKRAAKRMTKKK